jgi:Permuted papain-like amidase enzyme, YaeF/YiiX, C92 family
MTMKSLFFGIIALALVAVGCRRNSASESVNQAGTTRDIPKKTNEEILNFIKESKHKIKDGDLIERSDEDLVSESMRNFSKKDKTYSHCGLAFIEDGEVYVYNNMAGDENKSEKMMREPYDSFVSPAKKSGFGIFRYTLTDAEIKKLQQVTKENHAKGMLFDKAFDLKTDDKMYCAEMIYKFLNTATMGRILLPTSKIQNFRVRDPKYKGLVMKEFEYVGLDDLFLNPFCKPVVRISYK